MLRVFVGTSATYTAELLDNGTPVPGGTLQTFTLTWTDKATGTVINGRNAQNVLNANGVTIDGSGIVSWVLSAADRALVAPVINAHETHVALFRGTWAGGTKAFEHEVEISVVDATRACQCTDCADLTTIRKTTIVDLATIKSFLKVQPATAKGVTTLTRVGTVATATVANHGYLSGQKVSISGAIQVAYNGTYTITVLDANTFSYSFGGSSTSPATGTIVARGEDVSVDTILSLMTNGISEWIERETAGRVFQPRCCTEIQRGVGKGKIFLKNIPVVSVDELVDAGTTIPSSAFVVADPQLGIVELLTGAFSIGPGKVRVKYTAGYTDCDTVGPIPADATLLCLELVKAAYAELTSGAITFSSISAGPANIVVRQGLNPRHQRMLSGLKDVRL